jgi:hypothetical protein
MEMWKREKAKNNTKVYGNSVSGSCPTKQENADASIGWPTYP